MSILKYLKDKVEKLLNDSTPEHDQQCTWEDGYRYALYKIDRILEDLIKRDSCIYYHEGYGCDISPNKRCDSCDSKVFKPLPSPKFEIGNTIREINNPDHQITIARITKCNYIGSDEDGVSFYSQDSWELVKTQDTSSTLKRKILKSDNTTMFYIMFCGYCG